MKIAETIILIVFSAFAAPSVLAQNTAFTYQGSLKTSGQPANGNYDMQFTLHASDLGNSVVGATITRSNVAVVNGYFAVSLDWGTSVYPVFGARWIEIAVRQTGGGAYTTLNPRELLKAAPYAISSFYSETAKFADFLGGRAASEYTLTTDPRLSDARSPLPNSPNYLQNSTTAQNNVNFNISGNGTVSGILSASQFNIGGSRLVKTDQWNTLTIGIESGDVSTTGTAFNNSFVGFRAGNSTNGFANSFFGAYSGDRTTSGNRNAFFGAGAGYSNVTGSDNSLFGFDAGRNNLDITPTGSRNTIMGSDAGNRIVGDDNTFVGYRAGRSDGLGTGNSNTLVGSATSNYRGQGSFNTFIGYGAGTVNSILDYSTAIGAGAVVATSNTIQLGRATGNETVLIPGSLLVKSGGLTSVENGNVGIGTTNPQFRLDVADRVRIKQVSGSTGGNNSAGVFFFQNSPATERAFVGMETDNSVGFFGVNGGGWSFVMDTGTGRVKIVQLGSAGSTQLCRNASNEISTCSSSIRYKDNVQNFRPGLDLIKRLRPVSFNWKADGIADMGLVAEEVAAAEPLLTSTNDKGEIEGVKYDRVGVVLINAVKEQQEQIETLEAVNAKQQKQNDELQKQVDALRAVVCSIKADAEICKKKEK